ncbi:ABC transporter permease [Iamia sp. SCSIO 61187]|uniref:ABC transporter permease n=1 Tax=Iamia sp. SCSIO 61187 TaxID=2722752 RepID=UPI002102E84A|nr:ABC transporter permease [Iamia sp. SCSIO 61187]
MARRDDGEEDRDKRSGGWVPYGLLSPGVIWLILFFLVPMATLAKMSLSSKESRFDFEPSFTWEWANYTDAFDAYSDEMLRSFAYAGIATLLTIAIGYPVAYVIAFRGGRFRNVLVGLVVIPFFTSFLIRTLAWQTVLFDDGPVVGLVDAVGLTGLLDAVGIMSDGRLLQTHAAVIGGLTYNFLPFMILPIYVSLEKIDIRLTDAAKDLYSDGWRAFRKVVLPLSMPGVFAGTLLTFIPAAGDFVNARFLGGPNNTMIGSVVQDRFLVQLDYPTAAALSFVLMAIITVAVVVYSSVLGTDDLI